MADTEEAKKVKRRVSARDKTRRKKAGLILLECGALGGKPNYVEIKKGLTVADCVKASGFESEVSAGRSAKQAGLRLDCKRAKWTDKVTKDDSFIYFIPDIEGGK